MLSRNTTSLSVLFNAYCIIKKKNIHKDIDIRFSCFELKEISFFIFLFLVVHKTQPYGHGVLVSFLQEFHDAKINLTKLESRPAKKGPHFKYIFFIDFDGHYLDNNFQIIYKRYENNIKILGSFVKMV